MIDNRKGVGEYCQHLLTDRPEETFSLGMTDHQELHILGSLVKVQRSQKLPEGEVKSVASKNLILVIVSRATSYF